jgi:hypothetical protein
MNLFVFGFRTTLSCVCPGVLAGALPRGGKNCTDCKWAEVYTGIPQVTISFT